MTSQVSYQRVPGGRSGWSLFKQARPGLTSNSSKVRLLSRADGDWDTGLAGEECEPLPGVESDIVAGSQGEPVDTAGEPVGCRLCWEVAWRLPWPPMCYLENLQNHLQDLVNESDSERVIVCNHCHQTSTRKNRHQSKYETVSTHQTNHHRRQIQTNNLIEP